MTDDAEAPSAAPEAGPGRARMGRGLLVLAIGALVVAVGAAALALGQSGEVDDLRADRDDRREVALVASEFGRAYLSYDFDDVDASSDAVVALATDDFAERFEATSAPGIEELFASMETSTVATTDEVFVGDIEGDRARRARGGRRQGPQHHERRPGPVRPQLRARPGEGRRPLARRRGGARPPARHLGRGGRTDDHRPGGRDHHHGSASPMSEPTISVRDDGPVRVVAIERPARRNAVDRPTAAALAEAFRAFDADDGLAVAVLTGAGGTFCAGADLHAVAAGQGNRVTEDGDGPMGVTRLRLGKPVIAAIEGHAVAGGLEVALWCDLRVAARDAVLGVYCRRFGVPLVDLGTIRLPRLIGQSRAMDLILTGRGVAGDEALAMGLVNRLSEPGRALADAIELAHELAALPQRCMRGDRLSAIEQWDLPEDAAVQNELRHGLATIESGETQAGAARFRDGAGRHGERS